MKIFAILCKIDLFWVKWITRGEPLSSQLHESFETFGMHCSEYDIDTIKNSTN